jgi:hypothetical protein
MTAPPHSHKKEKPIRQAVIKKRKEERAVVTPPSDPKRKRRSPFTSKKKPIDYLAALHSKKNQTQTIKCILGFVSALSITSIPPQINY